MTEYNVFISYKALDEGRETLDAQIAEELYQSLSSNPSIVPFLDQNELVNMDGRSDFSNSIYSALDSASIFIFICSDPSYLHTNYVESEWTTYLTELNSGRKPKGSIYGITVGVDYEDLPIGLRRFEILPYSKENIQVVASFVEKRLQNGSEHESDNLFDQWKQDRNNQVLSRIVFADVNARQFIDDFLSQNNARVACLVQEKGYNNVTALSAEAVRLNQHYDVLFFFSVAEAEKVLRTMVPNNNGLNENTLIIIDAPFLRRDSQELQRILSQTTGPVIIQARGQPPKTVGSSVYETRLNTPDDHEIMTMVKAICRENSVSSSDLFINELNLPANNSLKKPSYILLIVEYMVQCGDDEIFDQVLPLYNAMDCALSQLDPYAAEALNMMGEIYLDKQISSFLIRDIPGGQNLVEKFERVGLGFCRSGAFSMFSEDFLFYKAAQVAIYRDGPLDIDKLVGRGAYNVVPFYLFLVMEQEEVPFAALPLKELNTELKKKLISLFINSDFFPQLARCISDQSVIATVLLDLFYSGQYSVVELALDHLVKYDPSYHDLQWVKIIYMSLDFYLYGRFNDCKCYDSLDYWISVGTIHYYRDDYDEAISSFENALKLCEDDTATCNVLMKYSDVLVDSGNTEALMKLLDNYQGIFDKLTNNVHYLIYRGNVSFNQAELMDAKEYYQEALSKLKKSYNAALIARVYGNMGLTDYYMGEYQTARDAVLKNEDISIDSDNCNGIAIARIYLGLTYLYTDEYEQAFNYFSSAMFYAKKAQNLWRINQINLLIDQFNPGFTDRIDAHVQKIKEIPSSSYHSDMYLLLAESMLRTGCDEMRIREVLNSCIDASAKVSNLNTAISKCYLKLLDGEEYSASIYYLTKYAIYAKHLFYSYRARASMNSVRYSNRLPFILYKEMESERLLYQHISKADAADIYAFTSRIQPTKYVLWERHSSIFVTMTYIEEILRSETRDDDYLIWTIISKQNNTVIGTIDLNYDENYGGVEIGIILSDLYWGNHFATEAINRISEYAKDDLKLSEIYGVCVDGNIASERMLQKTGFVFKKRIHNYHSISNLPNNDGLMFIKSLN